MKIQYTGKSRPEAKRAIEDITETMMETINLLSPESFSVIDFEDDYLISGLKLSNGYIKRMKKKGFAVDLSFTYATAQTPFKGGLKMFDTHGSSIYGTHFSVYEMGELANESRSSLVDSVGSQGIDVVEDGFHVAQVSVEAGREPSLVIFGTGNLSKQREKAFQRTLANHTCGIAFLDYENNVLQLALREVEGSVKIDLGLFLEAFREDDPEITDTELRSLPVVNAIIKSAYSDRVKDIELEEPDGMVQCQVIEDNGKSTVVCVPVSQG